MSTTLFGRCRLATLSLTAFVAASVSAASWFDAGISQYAEWPADGSDKVVEETVKMEKHL